MAFKFVKYCLLMIHFSIFNSREESLLFFICKCIVLIIFSYLNIIVLAFLRKHRMAPSNTTILIRGQTVCSLLMIFDTLFYSLTEDKLIYDFKYAILICYFVNYQFVYWFSSSYCVTGFCIIIKQHCRIIKQHCRIIKQHCRIIKQHCKIIKQYCKIIKQYLV